MTSPTVVTLYFCPECKDYSLDSKPSLCNHGGWLVPVEPIEFCPLPSAETRATALAALDGMAQHASIDSLMVGGSKKFKAEAEAFRAALAELTAKGWGE